ncbi:MAG: short-chain alcohol dehydrogenase like protein [Acidobacteria bacterium]|nr:short-chain alcohol dehydrogenase like protein [Acidobacteriota bacterium]
MPLGRILSGKFSLITGSTRGIGRAIADALAEHGCNVLITSRNSVETQAAAKEIGDRYSVEAAGFACDVSQQASVQALFAYLRKWSSDRLDILVCNAGFPFRGEIWETPLHATPPGRILDWYFDLFGTDTMGSVLCTFEALQLMVVRKSGSIIYITSTPALEGYRGTPYTVAKAATLGLMKDVAREYGRYNIRANALALGNIRTPATFDQLDEESRNALAQEAPLRRWGSPEEVGKAALFLASDLSGFITGQTIVVDGGTLRR